MAEFQHSWQKLAKVNVSMIVVVQMIDHLMGVNTIKNKIVDDLKFDPYTRFYSSATIMPVFKPLELCQVNIHVITTDCAPPILSIRQIHASTTECFRT